MTTSKATIKSWFEEGQKKCASHMVVVCDTFDWDDYPVFVMPGQDAREVAKTYDGRNMQKIMEVYNLALPLDEQINARRAMNF